MKIADIKELNELAQIYQESYEDAWAFAEKWWVTIEDIEDIQKDIYERLQEFKDDMIWNFNYNLRRINELNTYLPGIDEEIKRLQWLKKSYQWEIERRRDWIKFCMTATHTEKCETELNKLSFRSTKSVVVMDSEDVINNLTTLWLTRIKVEADKTKIKEAIENWEQIDWCWIVENKSLIIK